MPSATGPELGFCFNTTVGRLSESSFLNENDDSERLWFFVFSHNVA